MLNLTFRIQSNFNHMQSATKIRLRMAALGYSQHPTEGYQELSPREVQQLRHKADQSPPLPPVAMTSSELSSDSYTPTSITHSLLCLGYRMNNSQFESQKQQGLFVKLSRTAVGPTLPPIQRVLSGGSFPAGDGEERG